MTLLAALFLVQTAAQVAAPDASDALSNSVWSTLAATLLTLVGVIVRRFLKSKRAQQAVELLATIAVHGVEKAWRTYTAEAKASSPDGKLTDEQAATAKRKAVEAALADAGEKGQKLLLSVFKDGLDPALQSALETEYGAFKQRGMTPAVGVPIVQADGSVRPAPGGSDGGKA